MEQRVCKQCELAKPLEAFSKMAAQGPHEPWNLRKKCKVCVHEEYLSRRTKPARLKALLKSSRNWKKENPERHAELGREYRKRNPEKITAQNRLNYAVRKGLVVRLPCEVCGSTNRVHGHHHSYLPEDWYNVKWLCFVCHKIEHA